LGLEAGTIFGIAFVHWLFYQAVFNIQALCPFCMVVWVVTIVLFVYVTFYNLSNKYIGVPAKLTGLVELGDKYKWAIAVFWVLLIAGVILNQFWFYWKTII